MRKILSILCAAALLAALASCGAAETNTPDTGSADGAADAADGGIQNTAAQADSTQADAALVYTDSGVTLESGTTGGWSADGTALTISASGVYAISGSCADGTIRIEKGVTDVTLVLNGLTLCGGDTAALVCGKSSAVTIVAAAGTENTLSDAAENNDDAYPANADAENAVLKCKDGTQVTLCGTGALTITANGKNGVKSGASTQEDGEASLTIRELTLTIDAPVNDAINAEALLNIESGNLTIGAGDDAVHCDYTMNIGAADTDGPVIAITGCYEGLEAAELNILSGDISILSEDDCLNAANSDLSGYAFSMTISGGRVYACSTAEDGFDSNGTLTISGGTVEVWTANTADNQPLDADGVLTVSGGTVLAAGSSAGMGVNLSAAQPCVTFDAASMGVPGGQSAGLIAAGDTAEIQNAAGETLWSGTTPCSASYVFFSSAAVTAEENCTLTVGGTAVSTSAAQTGTVGGGMQPGGQMGQPGGAPDGQSGPMGNAPDGRAPGGNPPEQSAGQNS